MGVTGKENVVSLFLGAPIEKVWQEQKVNQTLKPLPYDRLVAFHPLLKKSSSNFWGVISQNTEPKIKMKMEPLCYSGHTVAVPQSPPASKGMTFIPPQTPVQVGS